MDKGGKLTSSGFVDGYGRKYPYKLLQSQPCQIQPGWSIISGGRSLRILPQSLEIFLIVVT